jgi:hypothetical protein
MKTRRGRKFSRWSHDLSMTKCTIDVFLIGRWRYDSMVKVGSPCMK